MCLYINSCIKSPALELSHAYILYLYFTLVNYNIVILTMIMKIIQQFSIRFLYFQRFPNILGTFLLVTIRHVLSAMTEY